MDFFFGFNGFLPPPPPPPPAPRAPPPHRFHPTPLDPWTPPPWTPGRGDSSYSAAVGSRKSQKKIEKKVPPKNSWNVPIKRRQQQKSRFRKVGLQKKKTNERHWSPPWNQQQQQQQQHQHQQQQQRELGRNSWKTKPVIDQWESRDLFHLQPKTKKKQMKNETKTHRPFPRPHHHRHPPPLKIGKKKVKKKKKSIDFGRNQKNGRLLNWNKDENECEPRMKLKKKKNQRRMKTQRAKKKNKKNDFPSVALPRGVAFRFFFRWEYRYFTFSRASHVSIWFFWAFRLWKLFQNDWADFGPCLLFFFCLKKRHFDWQNTKKSWRNQSLGPILTRFLEHGRISFQND